MSLFAKTQANIQQCLATRQKPVIIFDLDDTLIDCRHRKFLIIMEFLRQAQIQRDFAAECSHLAKLEWQKVQYRVLDTTQQAGIFNQEFSHKLLRYWRQHYFTYPYLLQDQAFPGALEFVDSCHAAGSCIVYLTGRDEAGMGAGTRESLHKLGFPVSGTQVHFILKPHNSLEDLDFKVSALEQIASFGEVIAAFENELINLNAMANRFPKAAVYWRKTLYLPNPPLPHPRVETLLKFE